MSASTLARLVRDESGMAADGNQYLWGLGLDEDHISTHCVCIPAMPLAEVRAKGELAARLEQLAGGKLKIAFHPGMWLDDEEQLANHVFTVNADDGEGTFDMYLDDSMKGHSPCFQLIDELQRVGQAYLDLAEEIEEAIERHGVPLVKPASVA